VPICKGKNESSVFESLLLTLRINDTEQSERSNHAEICVLLVHRGRRGKARVLVIVFDAYCLRTLLCPLFDIDRLASIKRIPSSPAVLACGPMPRRSRAPRNSTDRTVSTIPDRHSEARSGRGRVEYVPLPLYPSMLGRPRTTQRERRARLLPPRCKLRVTVLRP